MFVSLTPLVLIIIGLLGAVGKELFESKVSGKVLEVEEIKLPGGKTQHHVSFDVSIEGTKVTTSTNLLLHYNFLTFSKYSDVMFGTIMNVFRK